MEIENKQVQNVEMTQNEILLQILTTQKKQLFAQRILIFLGVCFLVILLLAYSAIIAFTVEVSETLTKVEEVVDNIDVETLNNLSAKIESLNIDEITQTVSEVAQTTQTSMEEMLGVMDTLDFDALNQTLEDLNRVMTPLSNFFR